MVCVGIDVAKDKHDCFIMSSEGEALAEIFTIPNSREGFETLLRRILDRVLHHCTVINIKGESYRLKERKEFMRQKQQIVNTLFEQGNA